MVKLVPAITTSTSLPLPGVAMADVFCPSLTFIGDMSRYARGFDWTPDIIRQQRELVPIHLAISIGVPSSIVFQGNIHLSD
jgi:hypothetical protein